MPRAVGIDRIVLVSPGDDTTHRVLTSSMGEPAVEPLMSNKTAIVANTPEGAVFGYVVGVRELAFGTFDTSGRSGALEFGPFRDVGLSTHGHYPTTNSWSFFVVQPGHGEAIRGISNSSMKDICNGDARGDGSVDVVMDVRGVCLSLEVRV